MAKRTMEGERKTKRVKLVHKAVIDVKSAPIQRRLRKMSEKIQSFTCSFLVQARLLCVGMSVVYRVSLSLPITNTCIWGIRTGSMTSSGGHATQSLWVIAMSQTKFRGFYAQVNALLHHPTVAQYTNVASRADYQQMQLQDHDIVVEWKPFQVFLQLLATAFRRYAHLQDAAFSIQADATTMEARKIELEEFLSECWKALEIIVPVLAVEPYLPTLLKREVLELYLLIRNFFSLSESVLDANCIYANAILSLEDVEDLLPTHSENSCSICLEPLASSAIQGLNSGSSNERNNREAAQLSVVTPTFSVRLPCTHVYHENCAMSWLRYNPTCPECRHPVISSL